MNLKDQVNMVVAVISCMAILSGCASGLYVSPEKTKYYGTKVIIYQEDDPESEISLQMPAILASEVPFRVISFTEATNLVGKDSWDSDDLAGHDVGLVIMVKDISFHRDVVKKPPMIQLIVGDNPPSWDWVYLSTIHASFTAYDVKGGNRAAEGYFPPETFRDYASKYGVGGCGDFESWVMSPEAIFWSEQYIANYVGKHTEHSTNEPTNTDTYYKLADRNATKKLVTYIAKKIPTSDKP
jgi:uncharacterized protein YceK